MPDYFEIDFLDVESDKSGDAITIRYQKNGKVFIHVVDAGFQSTGKSVADHIRNHYDNAGYIDHVVATHHDGDHSGGLRTILEEFDVGALWMLRPWKYAEEIIDRFQRFSNTESLVRRLKDDFPNFAALEAIADRRGIPIHDPFQGTQIGAFVVLAPSKPAFLDLVVESERTPNIFEEMTAMFAKVEAVAKEAAAGALKLMHADWGVEFFSTEPISAENRMSVVQYANLNDVRILLTADAGVDGLTEAADFAPYAGLQLPGIDRFQVPHHGSRRNVSTDILDRWLGERLPARLPEGAEKFTGLISSAKKDLAHPRNSVVRSIYHRGGKPVATESKSIRTQSGAPRRDGWTAVTPLTYPAEQEAD